MKPYGSEIQKNTTIDASTQDVEVNLIIQLFITILSVFEWLLHNNPEYE
jgi:hypothetical protein